MKALAQYYASVTMIDEGVGRVLDELDAQSARGETLVVYTSDHGLEYGASRHLGQGQWQRAAEYAGRIDTRAANPESAGLNRRRAVAETNLSRTAICMRRFWTLPKPSRTERSGSPGRSCKPGLKGEQRDWTNRYFGEYGTVRAIRDERYKLVLRYGGGENLLMDLRDDPRETVNVVRGRGSSRAARRNGAHSSKPSSPNTKRQSIAACAATTCPSTTAAKPGERGAQRYENHRHT